MAGTSPAMTESDVKFRQVSEAIQMDAMVRSAKSGRVETTGGESLR
jgi:hypothetical protein